jgi:hypothetical protein
MYKNDFDMERAADCLLHVNFRERGTEWIDRFGMDTIMGFGALVVGIGTYMAIAGADPKVHLASDLLTGYIGNTPCALYGVMNFAWSIFVYVRAGKHTREPQLIADGKVKDLLNNRAKEFKAHSFVSGMTGIVAGAASLLTYTYWHAYVVLAVCLVVSVFLNYFWRIRLGYDRPLLQEGRYLDFYDDDIIAALQYTIYWRGRLKDCKSSKNPELDELDVLRPVLGELPDVMNFLRRHNLFEEFCLQLCTEYSTDTRLFHDPWQQCDPLTIRAEELLHRAAEYEDISKIIWDVSEGVIGKSASRCFKYQQRWLLEALGCYRAILNEPKRIRRSDSERPTLTQLAAHTLGEHLNTCSLCRKDPASSAGSEVGDRLRKSGG